MPFDNYKTPPRTSAMSDQNHLSNIRMTDDAGSTDEPVAEYPARYPSNLLEAEEPKLIYPSSRLGPMTRKKNEIAELMTTNSADNIDLVSLKLGELRSKKTKFATACTQQQTLPNVGKYELMEFEI